MSGANSMAALAQNVLATAPDSFALIGLSMGGILAFELWRQAPERISHLGLIDTNPFAESPERRSLRLEQIDKALNGGLRGMAIESLKPLYLADSNRNNESLLHEILDMAMDLGPDVFRDQSYALLGRSDSTALLPTIDVPTAVICGAEDMLCPPANHEYMASEIPDATLSIIVDCGHLASMEQPEMVTDQIKMLLARTSKTGNRDANQLKQNSNHARR